MKLIKISDLFIVKYWVNLELINLEECEKIEKDSINFVSRTEKNNGISAYVYKISEVAPNPWNTISVAWGGSVLSTFYQKEEYYSWRDIYILIPKKEMNDIEMLFYCYCIRQNKYRYNYWRQANKTLKNIEIPEYMPKDREELTIERLNTLKINSTLDENYDLNTWEWKNFSLTDLFTIWASRDKLSDDLTLWWKTPYVTSSENNNWVTDYFLESATNKWWTITANRWGSVWFFFYQPYDYLATPVDVRILYPKFKIDTYIWLFIKTILQLEKYRYNYSRKMWTDRLKNFVIKLPVTIEWNPDWEFMRNYIKSLPYSSSL